MHTRALLVGAAALVAVAALSAQSPEPQRPAVTFRVQVNCVEIDAIVTDRQGRFVRDLTRDDFQLFEEGKPQPIAAFSIGDIPVEPRVEPPPAVSRGVRVPLDVVSNARPFEGRVFMLLLDDLQTSVLNSLAVRDGRGDPAPEWRFAVDHAPRPRRHRGDRRCDQDRDT